MDINLLKQWRFLQDSNSDFLYFFPIFQDVFTTLQYISRTEKKEQQITNYERSNVPSDQSTELHVMEKEKKVLLTNLCKKNNKKSDRSSGSWI